MKWKTYAGLNHNNRFQYDSWNVFCLRIWHYNWHDISRLPAINIFRKWHCFHQLWNKNLWWFLNHNFSIWLMKCVLFENRAQLLKRAKPTFQTSFSNFCTTDYFTWTSTQLFFDGHTLRMNCMYYGVILEGTADKAVRA